MTIENDNHSAKKQIHIGQRWSEFIEQLINEQSNISPSEKARQLLDAVHKFSVLRIFQSIFALLD